jgi:DNA-binding winged helix-turn-helix (wHTH) protein/tetratricopeptide (TPR) repeat protein
MRSVTFGPFQFDLDTHELHRSGIAVRLQPQPAKLLALLVERAGALVTRDEIRRSMWGDDTFVDFDQSVNFCVRRIRTALHDNADTPCYVETLPRRGYRFIAPVQHVEVEDDSKVAVSVAVAAPRSRSTRWHRVAIAAIVVLIAGVATGSAVLERARLRVSSTVSIAHQKVELGRFFLNKFSATDVQRAIEHFEAATREDPGYARAYAGLAEAYNQLGTVFIAGKPPANVRLLALRAAIRAIELDPTLAEAYAALGYTTLHEMDWSRAEAALRRAIELNPRNMPAHQSYASYLVAQGQFGDAITEARRCVELEPASVRARQILAWMLYFDRHYDAALEELHTVVQMDPTFALAHFRIGQVRLVTRRYDEAIPELETAVDLTHRAPAALGLLAMAYGGRGDRAEAQAIVDDLERRSATEHVPAGAVLLAYIGIDDKDRAIDALARGYAERDNYEINIASDPLMDPLRNDPRFEAICQQVMRGTRLAVLDALMPPASLARR